MKSIEDMAQKDLGKMTANMYMMKYYISLYDLISYYPVING